MSLAPPRAAPLPPGFLLLGMLMATLGAACMIGLAGNGSELIGRALLGGVAILSLLLVEALWWMRPWVVRAADAWAAGCIGAVVVSCVLAGWGEAGAAALLAVGVLVAGFVALPCLMVRWYVRDRARRLGLAP
jgi:hypothetical protein